MLSYKDGNPIAKEGNKIIYLQKEDDNEKPFDHDDYDSDISESESESDDGYEEIESNMKLEPLLDMEKRDIAYIAGPSGSGKSTFAVMLIKRFLKVYPEKDFFLFSRTDYKTDPAFNGMKVNQVTINESLIKEPIDITKELTGGCIVLFDDCNTIQDDKVKKAVDKLLADILEVGRKLGIWTVITNHLVIPNEKKIARTVLNELYSLTVFPKSGSVQQISYVLKQYFGLDKKQIEKIIKLPSRWVTIHKNYPMYVIYEHGVYLL
jgi:hypothetical protein